MSAYTIDQLANPLSPATHIYEDFTQRLGISLSKNIQVAALTAFAGLASMLGLGLGTPLIFRTIMTYGLEAISEDPLMDAVDSAISSYFDSINYKRQSSNKPDMLAIDFICHLMAIRESDSEYTTDLEKIIETIGSKYSSQHKAKHLINNWIEEKFFKSVSSQSCCTEHVIQKRFSQLVSKLNPPSASLSESPKRNIYFTPLLNPDNL